MKTKLKPKIGVLLLVAVMLFSALLIFPSMPTAKANTVEDAITSGLNWLDNMAYKEIGEAGTGIIDQTNRVQNNGFESSLDNTWECNHPGTNVYRSTQRVHSGSYSLKMYPYQDENEHLWATQGFIRDFSKLEYSFSVYVDTSENGATFGSQSGSQSRQTAIGGAIIMENPSGLAEISFGFASQYGYYHAYITHFYGYELEEYSDYDTNYAAIVNGWQNMKLTIYPNTTDLFPLMWNIELRWNDVLVCTVYSYLTGLIGNVGNRYELFNDAFDIGLWGQVTCNATSYFDDVSAKFDSTTGLAVALESPSLSFRIHRSDGYWTIFGKKDNLNLPPSASMIRGGALMPEQTTDDLGLITGSLDRQRMKYKFDIDGDDDYNDVVLYVEYATMTNTNTRVSGKVVGYVNKGLTLSLQLETTQVLATVSLNAQFSIDKDGGWAGRRYTIRPTTKGLADLYVWLGTTQFSWLGGQTYQQTRGVNYLGRALKLYRTWYGSGYIIDRFDGMYGATLNVRPWAGQYGIPNYAPNPDLILEPMLNVAGEDWSTYYVGSPTSNWYSYANAPNPQFPSSGNVLRSTTVSRHMMPDDEHWNNLPFQCSDTQFSFAYRSRTGFSWARNQYIANGFEYDVKTFNNKEMPLPWIDVVLGIGTDAQSIRACADMAKYGVNIPYGNGLSTLREKFIDSAQWDGNGIARDSWHGSSIGWPYPGYGTHNTATYANALTQYYKLTSDANYGAKADQVIGVLMMLQEKVNQPRFSRAESTSYYRAEFLGSFLPGYSVANSFGQIDVYSAEWLDMIYGTLQFFGTFQVDPASASFPCLGNAECTIPSVWALIQYRTTNRTPTTPQQPMYTLPLRDNAVAYTDHGGSFGGDGSTEIISQNVQDQYIGGSTGNLWMHTGNLDRIRMKAYGDNTLGSGWASIEYEWSFTTTVTSPNWRAKMYFTIPDYMAYVQTGGNSLTVATSLYTQGGSLISQESRIIINGETNTTGGSGTGGKMVFCDMAKVDSLAAGTYTVKLKFYAHAASISYIGTGYQCNPSVLDNRFITGNLINSLPMGLDYFGYDVGWNDNFDDNTRDTTKWDVLQVNGATANEANNQLEVTVPSGSGYAQAGYVTVNPQSLNEFTASVDVTQHNNLDEMTLQICTTKTTNTDPYNQNTWYRIIKNKGSSSIIIQSKINGGSVTTKIWSSWTGSTGKLTISVGSGSIAFYENNALKYSEPYALPSYNCYIYVMTSSLRSSYTGTDKFDNFGFSPTISGFSENENFTTYTEADPNNDITVTSSGLTTDTMRRDVSAYVYKDKETGHFSGDFEHVVNVKLNSADNQGCFIFWSLWNAIGGEDTLRPSNNGIEVMFYRNGASYYIYMREWYGNVNYDSYWTGVSLGTTYYLKIARTGSTLTTKIYSDYARTNLLATLSVTLHSITSYRYIYAAQSCASNYAPTATISGYSENLNLQEGGPPPTDTLPISVTSGCSSIQITDNTNPQYSTTITTFPFNFVYRNCDSLTFTANPATGYTFEHWDFTNFDQSHSIITTNPYTITLGGGLSLLATFEQSQTTEDFTTYTETDPNNDISKTSSIVTIDTMRRDVSAYVYKDKGIGYFSGDFEHQLDVKCTAADNQACWITWSLWNGVGGEDTLRPTNNGVELMFYKSGSTFYIMLREWYGNTNYDSSWTGGSQNTEYYLKIARAGSTLTTKIYSDATRTNLLATLTLNLHQTAAYRYIYAAQSCASSYYPSATISGYSENLSL